MNCDDLQQLTALEALGLLDGPDATRLRERLESDPKARAELSRFLDVAGSLAGTVKSVRPSGAVRAKVLERIRTTPQRHPEVATPAGAVPPPIPEGIRFMSKDAPWFAGPLPKTRFKILSAAPTQAHAMLLIELGPGALYPEHVHDGPEEMYVLTGDLQSEGRSLGPGDFLHAEPGSHHHALSSIDGCTAIMVVSRESIAHLA